MKSLEVQKEMNQALVNKSYKKAFKLFNEMNKLRVSEGLDFLTMPNLQKRFS